MKVVMLIFALFLVGFICCLRVIPEKAVVEFFNEKYIDNVSTFIKRYGRSSPYYFNFIIKTKHTWNNNVTVNLVFYEYLHNEYRRSFVEFHFGLCDLLNKDPYVGGMLVNAGLTCPMYPKLHSLLNMTVPTADFKYLMPFKKCMVVLEGTITSSGESLGRVNIFVTFTDKMRHI